jgi:hypothetical protein
MLGCFFSQMLIYILFLIELRKFSLHAIVLKSKVLTYFLKDKKRLIVRILA